ncbi:MAG: hypothetical protein J7507_06240 [Pseudoxanthomonas sp.]|nr:hypothetical protein [Pseudoxanthomonas sp.]
MATRKPIKPVPTAPRKPAAESSKSAGSLTSERISDDLDAFRRAGGRIEVLGNTRVLTKIDENDEKPSR